MQEHGQALEADLIRMGLRLRDTGSERFTWIDLAAMAMHPVAGTAYYRSVNGHDWTADTILAAAQLDALNAIIWQNGGGRGPKPKAVPRPEALKPKGQTETRKLQGTPMDVGAARAKLEARNGVRT